MPNIPETVAAFLACAAVGAIWSSAAPEFGARAVIDRFARSSRSCCSRSTATATAGRSSIAASSREIAAALPVRPGACPVRDGDGSGWQPGFLGELESGARRAMDFEQVPFDHPAVGPVQLGDDGVAQADRPQPGRDPAGAAQGLPPAPRRAAGRPDLLVLDDRLDDVEHARRRAADGSADRLFDGNPGYPNMDASLGHRRADPDQLLRGQRGLHRGIDEGRRASPPGAGSERAAVGRLDRFAAVARGLPLGVRRARTRHVAVLDLRRDRPLHGVCRWRADAAGAARGAAGAFARRCAGSLGRGRQFGSRGGRRAGPHRADAVDADLLLGR